MRGSHGETGAHFDVILEVVLSMERALTHRATEWFPVGMYQGVPHQLEFRTERLLALVAFVRRVAIVAQLVFGELAAILKRLLAHLQARVSVTNLRSLLLVVVLPGRRAPFWPGATGPRVVYTVSAYRSAAPTDRAGRWKARSIGRPSSSG